MATHIVMWNIIPELKGEEKEAAAKLIKEKLEALIGVIPNLTNIHVYPNDIPACTRDLALICEFHSVKDIAVYQNHPAHLEAASYIRTVTCDRVCFDF